MGEGISDTEEETGTNGSAQSNELNVTRLETMVVVSAVIAETRLEWYSPTTHVAIPGRFVLTTKNSGTLHVGIVLPLGRAVS